MPLSQSWVEGGHVCVSRGLEFLWVILFSCCRKLESIQKRRVEVFCEKGVLAFIGGVLLFWRFGVHRRRSPEVFCETFTKLKGKELVSESLF